MGLKNTENTFGLITRSNHWITAFAFILAIILAIFAAEFMEKGEAKTQVFQLHFSLGIGIFALMLIRIIWLKVSPNPKPIGDNRKEIVLSHIVKGFLYLSMLLLPISGYIMVTMKGIEISFFDLFTLPMLLPEAPESTLRSIAKVMHVYGGFAIIAVLLLHIAGALKHHLIYKDETLNRMLGKTPKT